MHFEVESATDKLGKENIYRVYHESDPVPMIPVFPFCHAPFGNMGYLIHTRRAFWPTDHMMGAYSKSINAKGRSWASLSPTGIHEPTETQMKAWLESNIRVEPQSTTTWEWVSWAFYYVIRKIVGLAIVAPMQAAFVGAITLADNIALLLKKGLDNSDNNDSGPSAGGSVIGSPGYWVERLMRKIMEILHWQPVINKKQLTQDFMQMALRRLIERSHHEATRAIQGLNG